MIIISLNVLLLTIEFCFCYPTQPTIHPILDTDPGVPLKPLPEVRFTPVFGNAGSYDQGTPLTHAVDLMNGAPRIFIDNVNDAVDGVVTQIGGMTKQALAGYGADDENLRIRSLDPVIPTDMSKVPNPFMALTECMQRSFSGTHFYLMQGRITNPTTMGKPNPSLDVSQGPLTFVPETLMSDQTNQMPGPGGVSTVSQLSEPQTTGPTNENTGSMKTAQLVDDKPKAIKILKNPVLICPFNQVYDKCHSKCPVTCENYGKVQSENCEDGCRKGCGCPPGKILKSNGQCVYQKDCQSLGN